MGVTLERVQFKFASIIGELCSEPDVLSQFAVWVDLRLAEYKLKGSISLDCSGESPDPIWLKGIKSAIIEKALSMRSSQATIRQKVMSRGSATTRSPASVREKPNKHTSHTSSAHSDSVESRLSDDGITVKQEADDGYAVGLNSSKADSRKRSLDESANSDMEVVHLSDDPSYLASKQSRLDDTVKPENESLMSIIGMNETDDTLDVSLEQQESISREIDYLIAQNADKSKQATDQQSADQTHSPHPSTSSASKGANNNALGHSLTRTLGSMPHQNSPSWNQPSAIQRNSILSHPLLAEGHSKRDSKRTQFRKTQLRCYVKKFESWLHGNAPHENRHIEDIPAEELDPYLATFFSTVTSRHHGVEGYNYNSLRAIRSGLEVHLRENLYPYSITSSKMFPQSQLAFKYRRQTLQGAAQQKVFT